MRDFARVRGDAAAAAQAESMIATASASVQRHLWQPDRGFYIGDTIGEEPLREANGDAFHTSDDLHGQVLAYRLGFGDLLPREQMRSHQAYVARDLATPFGLAFDRFSHQNWIMADHSNAALQLRWHAPDAWATSLRQLKYFRLQKKEATRHTAVIHTQTGPWETAPFFLFGCWGVYPGSSHRLLPHFGAESHHTQAALAPNASEARQSPAPSDDTFMLSTPCVWSRLAGVVELLRLRALLLAHAVGVERAAD